MVSASRHLVQDLHFEVEFETPDQAWEEQERLSTFAQGAALRIVEEEFDRSVAADEVLQLDVLEIDLGRVDPAEMETVWGDRLRHALQERLAQLRAARRSQAALTNGALPADSGAQAPPDDGKAQAAWTTPQRAELETLLHFIQRGRLPWHAAPDADPVALAARVWRHSAAALVAALRALAAPELPVRRMVRQLPGPWLTALEGALQGDEGAAAPPWPRSHADGERRLLGALSAPPGTAAAAAAAMAQERPDGPAPEPVSAELRALRRRLKALVVDDAPELSEADLGELLELWRRLRRDDGPGLRQNLQSLGTLARVRRRMARLWPEAVLRQLPGLWLGAHEAATVWELVRGQAGRSTGSARRRRWEAALRQLLVGGGIERFDRSALALAVHGQAPPPRTAGLRARTERAQTAVALPLAGAPDAPRARPPRAAASDAAAARAALREHAASWAQQRVLAAVTPRDELAECLSWWLPLADAQALAGLAFEPLPRAWQRAATAPLDAARRVQWCLQALAAAPEGPLRAHDLVAMWWRAIAVQVQSSPTRLRRALQSETPDPAERARRTAWLQWLPRSDADAGSDDAASAPSTADVRVTPAAQPGDRLADVARARLRLAQALASGAWHDLASDWPLLSTTDREALRGLLRTAGASAAARRRLAAHWPPELWWSLLALFLPAPAASALVLGLGVLAELCASAAADATHEPPGAGAAREQRRLDMRTAALSWLLWRNGNGADDDVHTVLAHVVRRQADVDGEAAPQWAARRLRHAHSGGASRAGAAELIVALEAVAAAEGPDTDFAGVADDGPTAGAAHAPGTPLARDAASRAAAVDAVPAPTDAAGLMRNQGASTPPALALQRLRAAQHGAGGSTADADWQTLWNTDRPALAAWWHEAQVEAGVRQTLTRGLGPRAWSQLLALSLPDAPLLARALAALSQAVADQPAWRKRVLAELDATPVHDAGAAERAMRHLVMHAAAAHGLPARAWALRAAATAPSGALAAFIESCVDVADPAHPAALAQAHDEAGGPPTASRPADGHAPPTTPGADAGHRLVAALQSADAAAIAQAWQALLAHGADAARVALLAAAERRPARRALVQALDQAAWRQLLALFLAPQQVAPVERALPCLAAEMSGTMTGDEATQLLRGQALTALLWQPGIDAERLLGQLLEQAAWQHKQPVPLLARRLGSRPQARGLFARWAAELAPLDIGRYARVSDAGPAAPGGGGAAAAIVAGLRASQDAADRGGGGAAALLELASQARHPARDAIARELESPLAARRLAQWLDAEALRTVVAWLRPADAPALQRVWPELQRLGGAQGWPVVARQVLRECFEEDRPLHAEDLLRRADLALRRASARAQPVPAQPAADTLARALADAPLPETGEVHHVANAGIVLAEPYLPRLFEMLGLVRDGAFVDAAAAERAALLLQFGVTGEEQAPEPSLLLNKLLCGLPLAWPLAREVEPTAAEREAVEGMWLAIIDHWKALGKATLAGLRHNFLQREGRLERGAESWQLQVQRKSFDVLIEKLPWGFSTIKYAWMPEVLHVQWS